MTFAEYYPMENKRFIKRRKKKLTRTLDIVEIMSLFKIHHRISKSISGSIQKFSDLECEILNQF